jgi:hypothetical protein
VLFLYVKIGDKMNKKQSGFAAIGAFLIVVVLVVIAGGGYVVMNKNKKTVKPDASISTIKKTVDSSVAKADGTAATAAKAASTQVLNEIRAEEDGLEAEDAATNSVSTSQVDKIGGSADVSKL